MQMHQWQHPVAQAMTTSRPVAAGLAPAEGCPSLRDARLRWPPAPVKGRSHHALPGGKLSGARPVAHHSSHACASGAGGGGGRRGKPEWARCERGARSTQAGVASDGGTAVKAAAGGRAASAACPQAGAAGTDPRMQPGRSTQIPPLCHPSSGLLGKLPCWRQLTLQSGHGRQRRRAEARIHALHREDVCRVDGAQHQAHQNLALKQDGGRKGGPAPGGGGGRCMEWAAATWRTEGPNALRHPHSRRLVGKIWLCSFAAPGPHSRHGWLDHFKGK